MGCVVYCCESHFIAVNLVYGRGGVFLRYSWKDEQGVPKTRLVGRTVGNFFKPSEIEIPNQKIKIWNLVLICMVFFT